MSMSGVTEISVELIEVDRLVGTEDNPRVFPGRDKENEGLMELAGSIREHGVLVPLLGRPLAGGGIEMRAGERRRRAAVLAGLERVPVIVRDMDDREALEVTVTENLQREELHPLEEARGVRTLLEHGWTLEQAGTQLGKSEKWVARRAQLTELNDVWCAAIVNEESPFSAWSVSHLELVARFPESTQTEIMGDLDGRYDADETRGTTVDDLRRYLGGFLQALGHAPWDCTDADLVAEAGACSTCSKRSDCQRELWDESDWANEKKPAPGARCLDVECWTRKIEAYVVTVEEQERSKLGDGRVVLVRDGYNPIDGGRYAGDRTVPRYRYEACKKSADGAERCVMVDGPQGGKAYWARPVGGKASGEGATAKPKSEQEKAVARWVKCARWVVKRVIDELSIGIGDTEPGDDHVVLPGSRRMWDDHDQLMLAVVFGTDEELDSPGVDRERDDDGRWQDVDVWARFRDWCGDDLDGSIATVYAGAVRVVIERLKNEAGTVKYRLAKDKEGGWRKLLEETRAACSAWGFDFEQTCDLAEERVGGKKGRKKGEGSL